MPVRVRPALPFLGSRPPSFGKIEKTRHAARSVMQTVQDDWLEDVIIVNESKDQHIAGDVSVFRSPGDACGHLEPWWVEQNEGFALDGRGRQITFGVRNNAV